MITLAELANIKNKIETFTVEEDTFFAEFKKSIESKLIKCAESGRSR